MRLRDVNAITGVSCLALGIFGSLICSLWMIPYSEPLRNVAVFMTMLGVWAIIPSSAWPKWLTSNSFVIFALHSILMYIGHSILKAAHATSFFNRGLGVWLLALCYLCLCCAIGYVLKRNAPRTAKILFGGR